jgi:hypothetical protein
VNTETNTTQEAATRQGWHDDGRVDIDAVRAGTPDLGDAPAILESLCDEVERLRKTIAKLGDMHAEVVTSLTGQAGDTWTVHLTNGLLTGYPTWQRAALVARQFNAPMVVRISGPAGTVPLAGGSLTRAIQGSLPRVLYRLGTVSDRFVAAELRKLGLEVATSEADMSDPDVTVTYRDDRVRVRIGDTEHVHSTLGYFRSDSDFARSLADLIHGQVQR